ncbi:MAG: hypothetical protein J5709_09870 [Bacteroidales bacterium]|nr:hypothetical protein [Bacteroidales bacterium]
MRRLYILMCSKGSAQHNICGDVMGRYAVSSDSENNLMLNLMSVEI